MSQNRTKGRKNRPTFNVKKTLVNPKIHQPSFTVPTRKKSEKHSESVLENDHYDGIKSFNPLGQLITLEDAIVSFYLVNQIIKIIVNPRTWKPFAGDPKRSAFIMDGNMELNSMIRRSQPHMVSSWMKENQSPSSCVCRHVSCVIHVLLMCYVPHVSDAGTVPKTPPLLRHWHKSSW